MYGRWGCQFWHSGGALLGIAERLGQTPRMGPGRHGSGLALKRRADIAIDCNLAPRRSLFRRSLGRRSSARASAEVLQEDKRRTKNVAAAALLIVLSCLAILQV